MPAEAFVMATSAEECHKRNRTAVRPVPEAVIDRMVRSLEEERQLHGPFRDEGG